MQEQEQFDEQIDDGGMPPPRPVDFGEPEPFVDPSGLVVEDWLARHATFENDRGQVFRITAAARNLPEDQESLERFARDLRVYLEAKPVADGPAQKRARPVQPGEVLAEVMEDLAEAEDVRVVRVIIIDLEDAPGYDRGVPMQIRLRVDPTLGWHERDCWTGPWRFGIDVSEGKVRVDRPNIGSVDVVKSDPYRELAADRKVYVVGLWGFNRYYGDSAWTLD